MAMIKCNECKKEISDKAPKCPHCGCPNVPKIECPECKQIIDSTNKVCPNCGVELTKTISKTNANSKSKIAAGLLGILLGCFGAHNFYLGYTGKAVAQLLITVLSCFVFSFVSAVWGLIEGIMILTGSITTDAEGKELVD